MRIFDATRNDYQERKTESYSIQEYLELCKNDPMAYSTAAERMLKAIGEPELVDTSEDPRLSRIFNNRTIRRYPAFRDFHGMESTIEKIVAYFRHSAQGLEEKKQILYLLGPVGGGKSSLAEKLKVLMEVYPIYVLEADGVPSPVLESPLGLFSPDQAEILEEDYGIPRRYITGLLSPWGVKRLDEFGGDITKFRVVRMKPSKLRQIAVAKTEPGDDNNQDISALVGRLNFTELEKYGRDDPDAYSFSGGLNRTTQGMLEFVEMFKAPIKVLHPLLTATQEGNYTGTESFGAIPYSGIILAHSNMAEWEQFRNNKNNEAFLDRVCIVKVPYCIRVNEERQIYEKYLTTSDLHKAPCAPQTLDMMAKFSVLTRLAEHENSNVYTKMRVYNGEDIRDSDPRAKSMSEYREVGGVDEGMTGTSTRFAFKVLSETFNFDPDEVAADPVHLLYVLENTVTATQFPDELEKKYLAYIKEELHPRYVEEIGNELQKAYVESYGDYGQNLFDRYVEYADHWIENQEYKDPDTGILIDRDTLNSELEKIEKPAGIANPKDFRQEVVTFCLRARGRPENKGKNPKWTSYEKLREVIEKKMFTATEELLPVISFGTKKDKETTEKHNGFVERMTKRGYTEKQIRRLVEFYIRASKAS